jgi:2-amino-4-hydroxy-6-hydroxymethyldihydropteridine diphosphokinase
MGTLALIGLGSNVGDRKSHLDAAVAALAQTPGVAVQAVSSHHQTAPVGGPQGQAPYLNAAATLDTSLSHHDLLKTLRLIESREGRIRSVHWGERTLDLDLLLFGDQIIATPELEVPHPRFAIRRFVLAPACEVAPTVVDPVTGRSLADLLARLERRPSYVAILCAPENEISRLVLGQLVERLNAEALFLGSELKSSHRDEWLERGQQELRADRWTAAEGGDRWLVSDFWFDHILQHDPSRVNLKPEEEVFLERFLQARRQVIEPTFVAMSPSAEGFDRRSDGHAKGRLVPHDVPIIRLNSVAPNDMVDEVLAACAATRGS